MRHYILAALLLGLFRCNNYQLLEKLENPGDQRTGTSGLVTGPAFKTDVFAFWNMNGNLNDSWDNGTGLQNASAAGFTYTNDRFGRTNHAVSFPLGTSANFGHYTAYATGPFTVCMWFRLQTAGTFQPLTYFDGNGYSLQVRDTAVGFDLFVQNNGIISEGAPLVAGVWYYACIAYDSPAILYTGQYGGSLTASLTGNQALTAPAVGTNLTIGAGAPGAADFDDIVFYSRKLTLAEAQQNFGSDLQ